MQAIPVIDLDDPMWKVANEVDHAATHFGFFHVMNHGVPAELQRAMFCTMEAFFGLPLEVKKRSGMKGDSPFRGYFAELQEKLDFEEQLQNYKGDLKEGFDCGFDSKNSKEFFGPNQWPEMPAEFKKVAQAYLREMEVYCGRLMRVFAVALGQPAHYFDSQITDPLSTLRFLHYRPTFPNGSRGCAAHTDYGTCTALLQDQVGGLQIKLVDGRWIDVDPLEGSYVTNLGDMLQYWSGGRWRSTIHRVVNESPEDRYSIPFFYNPNRNAAISPLRSQTIFDGPPKTCEEILAARYQRSQIFPTDGIG